MESDYIFRDFICPECDNVEEIAFVEFPKTPLQGQSCSECKQPFSIYNWDLAHYEDSTDWSDEDSADEFEGLSTDNVSSLDEDEDDDDLDFDDLDFDDEDEYEK